MKSILIVLLSVVFSLQSFAMTGTIPSDVISSASQSNWTQWQYVAGQGCLDPDGKMQKACPAQTILEAYQMRQIELSPAQKAELNWMVGQTTEWASPGSSPYGLVQKVSDKEVHAFGATKAQRDAIPLMGNGVLKPALMCAITIGGLLVWVVCS